MIQRAIEQCILYSVWVDTRNDVERARAQCFSYMVIFSVMTCGMAISSRELIWLSFEGAKFVACRALE